VEAEKFEEIKEENLEYVEELKETEKRTDAIMDHNQDVLYEIEKTEKNFDDFKHGFDDMNTNLAAALEGKKQIVAKANLWGVEEPAWRDIEMTNIGRNLSLSQA